MIERAGLALLVVVPVAAGYFALRGGARLLAGASMSFHGPAWMLLLAPLAACVVAELSTELWERTPGALGTGTLVLVVPMLLLGVLCAAGHLALSAGCPVPEVHSLREAPGVLTAWAAVTAVLCAAGLALWRFWPEPTARLW